MKKTAESYNFRYNIHEMTEQDRPIDEKNAKKIASGYRNQQNHQFPGIYCSNKLLFRKAKEVRNHSLSYRVLNIDGRQSDCPVLFKRIGTNDNKNLHQTTSFVDLSCQPMFDKLNKKQLKVINENQKVFFKFFNKSVDRNSFISYLQQFGNLFYISMPFSKKNRRFHNFGYAIFYNTLSVDVLLEYFDKYEYLNNNFDFMRFDSSKYVVNERKASMSNSLQKLKSNENINTTFDDISMHMTKPCQKAYHTENATNLLRSVNNYSHDQYRYNIKTTDN